MGARPYAIHFKHLLTTWALAITVVLSTSATGWAGEKVLFNFDGANGANPAGLLLQDAAGNLYGTTYNGGASATACVGESGCGTVFKLVPTSSGAWKESMLYSFMGGNDGQLPLSLIMDHVGNLYGTTEIGGGSSNCQYGCGIVFKLSRTARGQWRESILYDFNGGDGAQPDALAFDAHGNLFGTTAIGGGALGPICGGQGGCGTVFELTPTSSGPWTLTTLHVFTDDPTDGNEPTGLIFGAEGVIYGATVAGGSSNQGAVFEMLPVTGGWTFTLIHGFSLGDEDAGFPNAGVILDAAGNLYGTTLDNYTNGDGTVFELSPRSGGNWTLSILYTFLGGTDGKGPRSPLSFDAAGSLYGTTYNGGGSNKCSEGCGTVFKLVPSSSGTWTYGVIFVFDKANGAYPGGLTIGNSGNFYGPAQSGGSHSDGLAFSFRP